MSHLSKKLLELYFQQLVLAGMNRAWYYRRLGYVSSGTAALEAVADLYRQLKDSDYPDTLHTCARFAIAQGTMYMETMSFHSALAALIEGIKCLYKEQRLRYRHLNYLSEERFDPKQGYKIRRNVKSSSFNPSLK